MVDELIKAVKLEDDAQPAYIAGVYASIAFLIARLI